MWQRRVLLGVELGLTGGRSLESLPPARHSTALRTEEACYFLVMFQPSPFSVVAVLALVMVAAGTGGVGFVTPAAGSVHRAAA